MIESVWPAHLRLLKCSVGEKVETIDPLDALSSVSKLFPSLQELVRAGRAPSAMRPFRGSHWEMEK